jgi:hypothetical protein
MAAKSRRTAGDEVQISTSSDLLVGAAEKVPAAPSFGMCEGVRTDLEQVEKTTDPFTGQTVTRDES